MNSSQNKSKNNKKALNIKEIVGGFKEQTKYFARTIYNNFIYLKDYPQLKHTFEDINKLLKSVNMYSILIHDINGRIIAYLIGEILELDDGKTVLYIDYLYVVSTYRELGIASKILDILISKVNSWDISGIMLTMDTENKKIYDFYLKRGFMPDQKYRRYERHDILSKYI